MSTDTATPFGPFSSQKQTCETRRSRCRALAAALSSELRFNSERTERCRGGACACSCSAAGLDLRGNWKTQNVRITETLQDPRRVSPKFDKVVAGMGSSPLSTQIAVRLCALNWLGSQKLLFQLCFLFQSRTSSGSSIWTCETLKTNNTNNNTSHSKH